MEGRCLWIKKPFSVKKEDARINLSNKGIKIVGKKIAIDGKTYLKGKAIKNN